MTNQKLAEIDNINEELGIIKNKLDEHSDYIYDLQESTRRLEGGQERQAMAIQELSANFGSILGELSKLGAEYRKGKKETLDAIMVVNDHVILLDSENKKWRAVCNEKHKLVDFRLDKSEKSNNKALKDISDMSDQSKVYYIQNLQEQIDDYKEKTKEIKTESRDLKKEKIKIVIAMITALFTGTGGAVLIQWILEKF